MKLAASTLVMCVSALVALGMVMMYSAGMTQNGSRLLLLQLIWCGLGVIVCSFLAWLDYRRIKPLVLPALVVSVILLALVLAPGIGIWRYGARRWLNLGVAMFQPSELAKLALVAGLAWYGSKFQRRMPEFWRGLAVPGAGVLLVLGLIFVEPDRGCTILLAAVTGVLLVVAGVRLIYIIPPAALFVTAIALALWMDPVRRDRILAFLHPEQFKDTAGFQTLQGLAAFASGGWSGRGLGSSRQKLEFLPFHTTDFIFPIVGEELGLIATLLVVLAFILIALGGFAIALRAREPFGRLLATGLTCLIAFQALINLGVVTGWLPNKGMPMPFLSYGGCNLLLMLTCVGLLLSIARHSLAADAAVYRPLETDSDVTLQPT